jgi:type I restriction enzyme S subunit
MLNGYREYKNIPEFWLSSIPDNWACIKIKHIFKERVEKGYPNKPLLAATQNIGVVPKNLYGNRTVEASKDLHLLKLVKAGDFVISLRSFQGGIEYAYYEGIISPAYTIMIPNNNSHFFRYLFKSIRFIELLQNCVTGIREGQNIDYSKLRNHLIPIPPRSEQDQIIRYLDWKVSMINKYINAKKKQIELLKEQRQTMINETVRRGQGQKYRFRHLFTLIKGLNITKADLVDSGVPCVSYGEIHSRYGFAVNPDINALRCVEKKYLQTNPKSLMKYGDFVFADTSEDIAGSGNFTYLNSNTQAFAGYHTIIARPNKVMNYRYLAYFFDSLLFREQIQQNVNGVKVYSITRSILNDTFIFLPSADEQLSIVALLDEQCKRIDRLVNKFNEEIMLFTEYRTRLISDVVTGKVDVQGEKVPEFEIIESQEILD